ncbi:MAG TPA: hypothetical protein VG963_26300, partial [Polyangiaceae bacterium]|nr:hypothetical protein [Polyangiaceae bacterium]
ALDGCGIDDRQPGVSPPQSNGSQQGSLLPSGGAPEAAAACEGTSCVAVGSEQPNEPTCLLAGCPTDDACRSYAAAPQPNGDSGCLTAADCSFTWKPAARGGDACQCDDKGCVLRLGEACSAASACGGASCAATATGGSVCCAQACKASEVCTPDGSSCVPADPCTDGATRCSGALNQSCVAGAWQTVTDCGTAGCSNELAGCLHPAGQACTADAECGEGTCLAAADGTKVCCTAACGGSCLRCSLQGTTCVDIDDDDACGSIECPTDPCRSYTPGAIVGNRCSAGQCKSPEAACTAFQAQGTDSACSDTALCDNLGNCSRPKKQLLDACSSDSQCASGACVAAADGSSVCCSQACAASQVCNATGGCGPAPVCTDGATQCSGSNFQRCVGGQWATTAACGTLGCSVQLGGCLADTGQTCSSAGQCASRNCVDGVCCNSACNGLCETCATTGICRAADTDPACGSVSCGNFASDCVSDTSNTFNVCKARGQCRTTADCGFLSSTTRCGQGGLCNGQGVCQGPSVQCGNQTCSGNNVCCSMLDLNSNQLILACGNGSTCSFPNGGFGPTVSISCDQNADCTGSQVCCIVTGNTNSGEISCRQTCTAEAVGAELGAPPEMLVVGQLCGSPQGPIFLQCPAGQSCGSVVNTLPSQYMACQ